MKHFLLAAIVLSLVCAVSAFAMPAPADFDTQGGITLSDLQSRLRAETPARDLTQASIAELQRLLPSEGGVFANLWSGEYVTRIGTSTFIIDMRVITSVLALSLLCVVLFFTPLGLILFRGALHKATGKFLLATSIAPDLGRLFTREPQKWLSRGGRIRTAFAGFMREDFIPLYRNNITALAFIGTAFLILIIGLRGIKFLVPHQPDLIIVAIIIEISVLCMLGMTTWYERDTGGELPEAPPPPAGDLAYEDVKARLQSVIRELEERHGALVSSSIRPSKAL
ncbi:MAG: hypothetical protein HY962_13985 [Ignavibacteriae bacterium]|nr:hypothetical protein [Ignavibacteriota bacterium]